jgi:hypothetical protein
MYRSRGIHWLGSTLAVLVGGSAISLVSTAPVVAEPTDDPCELAMATFLCRVMPMAPELSGDVDLINQMARVDPNAPVLDRPPVGLCPSGCY